jgi:C_GCAxxG_C_C family probable redox protein
MMSESPAVRALRDAAIAQADAYYLDDDHPYGCAETVFMTLKGLYGLEAPSDASAAMAFNGGIAYSGGPCGAITGGAMAVGILAEQRLPDHQRAKTVARELVREAMELFQARHGAVDCRTLIGYDLQAPGEHQTFIDSGLWREACAGQIRTVVGHLAGLADDETWAAAVREIEGAGRR